MKYGHTTGTKAVSRKSQSWYDQTAQENIERIEREDAERAAVTTLAKVVGDAVTALPDAASRIAKAATIVQHHDVWPLSTKGSYLVGSQSDAQSAHLVKRGPWTCDCRHTQYRRTPCAHQLAVMLTVRLGATYQPSY